MTKKPYTTPEIAEIGDVRVHTAMFGTSPRTDFNEFSNEQQTGSFDVCDNNPANNPGGDFCTQN